MKKLKRLFVLGACTIVVLVTLVAVVGGVLRPGMPNEWRKLRKGMSRQDAAALFQDKLEELQDLKGYDEVTHETSLMGSSSFWQLHLRYDSTGHVASVSARFVCRSQGCFNKVLVLVE